MLLLYAFLLWKVVANIIVNNLSNYTVFHNPFLEAYIYLDVFDLYIYYKIIVIDLKIDHNLFARFLALNIQL